MIGEVKGVVDGLIELKPKGLVKGKAVLTFTVQDLDSEVDDVTVTAKPDKVSL